MWYLMAVDYHRDPAPCDETHRVRVFQAPRWAWMPPMQQVMCQDSSLIPHCSLEIYKHEC